MCRPVGVASTFMLTSELFSSDGAKQILAELLPHPPSFPSTSRLI